MMETATNASFTGTIPENYDTYLGPLLFEFSAADMAKRVTKALGRTGRVLEIACGTGIGTRHLSNRLPEGVTIVATDLNEAMLAHAKKVNGDLPGVTYEQADALDLPFEDASFDAVVCQFGIMFFPDKAAGMREMNRVLRPAGPLALNVWDSFDTNPAVRVVDGVIKSFFDNDPPRFLEAPFGMSDTNELCMMFSDVGYEDVEFSHVQEFVEVRNYRDAARGFITGNPTIIEVEQRATVGVEELIAAAAEALEREFGPAPTKLPFQEIAFLANKPIN
jgi:ubiquinone/menaquinone biosynthesis C-methylase UbiE